MNGMRAGGKRDVETIELGDTKSPSPSQKHSKIGVLPTGDYPNVGAKSYPRLYSRQLQTPSG